MPSRGPCARRSRRDSDTRRRTRDRSWAAASAAASALRPPWPKRPRKMPWAGGGWARHAEEASALNTPLSMVFTNMLKPAGSNARQMPPKATTRRKTAHPPRTRVERHQDGPQCFSRTLALWRVRHVSRRAISFATCAKPMMACLAAAIITAAGTRTWRARPWRRGAWSGVPGVGARCGNGLFSTYKSPDSNFILASLS